MDVRLPDGTVVTNVPEGVTQSELLARVAKTRPSAAERIASDPITKGAEAVRDVPGAALLAGSAPGRFLLQPARGLLELGSHLGLPGGESAHETGKLIEQGRAAYENKGMDLAGLAGQVASPAVLGAARAAPAIVAGTKLLPRMAQSAIVGGAAGAVTPTEDKGDFAKEKALQVGSGATVGAVLPPAGALVKGLGKTIYSAFEPMVPGGPAAILNRFQTGLVGPAKDKIVQALMAAKELVPGSKPTAGEAVAALPEATGLAAHQQIVAKSPPASQGFAVRAAEQESARSGALESMAKTPADLKAAQASRSAQAATDYEAAFAETVKRDKELSSLMKDPYFKDALPAARDLAKSKGILSTAPEHTIESLTEAFKNNTVPLDVQRAINNINASGRSVRNMSPEQLVEAVNEVSGRGPSDKNLTQFLDYVKVGLDKQLSRTGDTALAAKEKEAVVGVKERLLAWMDDKNPAYAVARKNFADASRPINQMEAGQFLGEKLHAPLPAEGGHIERAGIFSQAVRDAPKTMEQATGYASELPPELKKVADAIAGDLGRKAQFERLARGTNLRGADMTPESPLPNLLSRPAMAANWIAKKLGHDLTDKVNTVAGELYLDPTKLAQSLADKPLSQRKQIIDALMKQYGQPVVTGVPSVGLAQQY